MNLKNKIARKALSWLVSIVMIVSAIGINSSFSTFANEQQEIDFCIDKMKNLPTDDEFLDQMRKLPTEEDLNQSRHEEIFHSDGSKDSVDLDEKEVYEEIKKTVDELTKEFEIKESAEEMLNFADKLKEEDGKEKIQTENSNDLPAKMQKADAIYRWVAENIHYDFESFEAIKNPGKTLAKWKPQDAYFVFSEKTGVCDGYARLLNLMMRMAEIPCMYVCSINGPTENYGHAFNAVYLEDENEDRKGWTLLDSCWASPGGSDGNAEIKKHLSGKDFYSKHAMEDVLAEKNNYTDELFDEFKIPENGLENPSQEFVDGLNKKIPDILKKLNEKYKDSPHFETIEFFVSEWGGLYFKYKTDLTAEQAKQAKDKLKELKKNQAFKDVFEELTGKSKIDFTNKIFNGTSNDMTIEDLKMETDVFWHFYNILRSINDNIGDYCGELEKIYIDLLFPNLNEVEEKIENINEDLNKKLEELNEKYSDITTIKKIKLSIEKDDEGFQIFGKFDTELSEQDLKTRFEQYKDNVYNETKNLGFEEYFPAFYKKDQSFEEANESIVAHRVHKISSLEDFGPTDASSIETYLKINTPALDGRENEAKLSLAESRLWSKIKSEDITEKVYKFFNKVTISDNGIKFGDSSVYHNTHNFEFSIPGYTESLTIEGDATVDISNAFGLKEIDTTKSRKYHAENGILYHTVNDQIGTKGEKISEIPPRSTDIG